MIRRALDFARRQAPPKVVRLAPANGKKCRGAVLISYLTECFKPGFDPATHYHSNRWECAEMARIWTETGFRVEIVDFNEKRHMPPPDSAAVIDIHHNLEMFANATAPETKKILHITGMNWLVANRAELDRLLDLQKRRGVSLAARRQMPVSRGIEFADTGVYLGNDVTIESFAYARKPLHRVPISSTHEQDWPGTGNYEDRRKRFLWIGSQGLVHKGLDLVLEAFAATPSLHLTICGHLEGETDFCEAYKRELSLPNIHALGWVTPFGQEFAHLLASHCCVVYPSCSEGGAGSVIACLHAGLLPVVSREATVETGDFGLELPDTQINTLMKTILLVSSLSEGEFTQRSRAAWELARKQHTRGNFSKTYRRFVESQFTPQP